MDGGLILTRNLLIMREGEVVGHLCSLRVLDRYSEEEVHETEVVLHLLESGEGGRTFHAWCEVGKGLEPPELPLPAHRQTHHEIEPICYDTTCVHFRQQPDNGNGEVCPKADLRGWLALTDDSWDGVWHSLEELEVRCSSYEKTAEKRAEQAEIVRSYKEAQE